MLIFPCSASSSSHHLALPAIYLNIVYFLIIQIEEVCFVLCCITLKNSWHIKSLGNILSDCGILNKRNMRKPEALGSNHTTHKISFISIRRI